VSINSEEVQIASPARPFGVAYAEGRHPPQWGYPGWQADVGWWHEAAVRECLLSPPLL